MLIVQHVPGFVDVERELPSMIPTISAAWNLPWVRSWGDDPNFDRFEKSIGGDDHALLMAKMKDGRSWVVARVYCTAIEQIDMDLPVWVPPARGIAVFDSTPDVDA